MSGQQVMSLVLGLFFLLSGVFCVALAWLRRISGPHPWTVLDAGAGLVSMIAFSGAGMLLFQGVPCNSRSIVFVHSFWCTHCPWRSNAEIAVAYNSNS